MNIDLQKILKDEKLLKAYQENVYFNKCLTALSYKSNEINIIDMLYQLSKIIDDQSRIIYQQVKFIPPNITIPWEHIEKEYKEFLVNHKKNQF